MKTTTHVVACIAVAMTGMAAAASAAETEPTFVLEPGNVPPHVRRLLEENAREGMPALVRYLNRSRFMHQLRVEDVLKAEAKPDTRAETAAPEQPTLTAERRTER